MLAVGEVFHFTLNITWIGLLLLVTVFGFYAQVNAKWLTFQLITHVR